LVLGAFLLFQVVFQPLHASRERLEASIRTQEEDLAELKRIVAEYDRLSEARAGAGATVDFNLFSLLEELAASGGLMDRVDYMRPGSVDLDATRREDWVEIKLGDVTLKELTEFLYRIRSSGRGVYVKRLSARKEGDYLDIVLQPAVARVK
jgi:type II secretory pathway component PulM